MWRVIFCGLILFGLSILAPIWPRTVWYIRVYDGCLLCDNRDCLVRETEYGWFWDSDYVRPVQVPRFETRAESLIH